MGSVRRAKKAKKKTKKIAPKLAQKRLINFKVSASDFKTIKKRADEFTGGNISEWLRLAGVNFEGFVFE